MRSEVENQVRHARTDSAWPADRGRNHAQTGTRESFVNRHSSIINHPSSIINPHGFTLVELLVVIAVIAVLLAIFIPVTRAARERGQRAVCLSNLRQLTVAWIAYADDHDGWIVSANTFGVTRTRSGTPRVRDWVGPAFAYPESRSALMENPEKGALWRYVQDMDVYRCPRGRTGHVITYSIFSAANGSDLEGVAMSEEDYRTANRRWDLPGNRVGNAVLRWARLGDIMSPSPGERGVFIDHGQTPSGGFYVPYFRPMWDWGNAPPVHHSAGATLSMADGHVEYWKWKGRETVTIPHLVIHALNGLSLEGLDGGDYEPKTADGLYDLQRVQKAAWGRLGYSAEHTP